MTTTTPTGIQGILDIVTAVVTESISWITSFAGAITANPLILMFVVVTFVGIGVGLIRRLMRL